MFKHLWISLAIAACLSPLPLAAANDFGNRESRYHLHPGDVITVHYRYTPEYDATVSLEPDGFASLPLLGGVELADLTVDQAQDRLKAKASARLNNPELTVELKEFEKPYIVVGGEVARPGKIVFHGHLTALRAVELAGGLRQTAKSSQILLIRQVNNVDAEVKVIDLKKVLKDHRLAEDLELRAGDLLVVPQSRLAKVERITRFANYGMYLNPLNP